MANSIQQIPLNLEPADRYALKYFVAHTGVAEAYAVLEHAARMLVEDVQAFSSVYVFGPAGSGKRHLINGFRSYLLAEGYPEDKIVVLDLDRLRGEGGTIADEQVGEIVRAYEERRSAGGAMLIYASVGPLDVSGNPHLTSRLQSGAVVSTKLPSEAEMEPVIKSLLERRNLKLSERTLSYVLSRLPLNPLNFDSIFARINEVSFEQSKPAGPSIAREIINSSAKD